MNRKIEIKFTEEAAVEIRAVATSVGAQAYQAGWRQFWLGWQLFRAV
jgi:hypothetical protein